MQEPHTCQKLRGVSFDRVTKKWRARLYCAGQHVTLGRFATPLQAARTHDAAAYFVHGENAVTNFGVQAARELLANHPPRYSGKTASNLRNIKARLVNHREQWVVDRAFLRARRQYAAQQAGLPACSDFGLQSTWRLHGTNAKTIARVVQTLICAANRALKQRRLLH
jgi:AP2 domain